MGSLYSLSREVSRPVTSSTVSTQRCRAPDAIFWRGILHDSMGTPENLWSGDARYI